MERDTHDTNKITTYVKEKEGSDPAQKYKMNDNMIRGT